MAEMEITALHSQYSSLQFMGSPTSSTSAVTINNSSSSTGSQGQVCLLHDPPDLLVDFLSTKALAVEDKVESINDRIISLLDMFLSPSRPLVIILSDVVGTDDINYSLNTCVPIAIRHRFNHLAYHKM